MRFDGRRTIDSGSPMTLEDKRHELLESYGLDVTFVGLARDKTIDVHVQRTGRYIGTFSSALEAIRMLISQQYGRTIKSQRDLDAYAYRRGIYYSA